MISVCVDARMLNNSGIGVYIREYVKALLEDESIDVILMGRMAEIELTFNDHLNKKKWKHIEADIPIYSILEQIKIPKLVPSCDIFWSPHYNVPLLPIRAKKRLVTIPDVFHLAHLDMLSNAQKLYAKIVTNAAVRWSNRILTISNFSKEEIIRLTSINSNKIKIIYLGMDLNYFSYVDDEKSREKARATYNLPEKYILFVGNVKPNKNLRLLVDAFSQLTGDLPDTYLLIAGKKNGFITGDPALFGRIEKDSELSKRVIFSGYIENDHLPVLYSMAHAFAFPSLYEGFGFPPLEAMACRCPVVASNGGSIPEICGDAPLYIDPYDATDVANGIRKISSDKELREQLVKNGLDKVKRYDWEESKRRFMDEIIRLANC